MQNKYRKLLFITMTLLIIIGIIMIYSASYIWAEYKFSDSFKYVKHQLVFITIGFILIKIIINIDYKFLYKYSNIILLVCFSLLIIVLIPGIGVIRNGSRSWFGIGSFGVQPSEAAKLGLIIYASIYLEKNNKIMKNIKSGVFPILFVTLIFFGLIMLEPDFGTGVILVMTIIMLLFISGVKMRFFYIIGILGVLGIIILIGIAPYRLARITSYLNPWLDPLGSGFQIIQSLYAIGPGGLLGFGFLNSRQKHFYLPEPQTDFIFAIICEEFGILGAFVVIILFFLLCCSGIKLAINENNLFKKYLIFGIIFQLIFQTILNLCVVVGLIPVTGVTLPFISYGGSSLLISMISIGIILNISRYTK